MPVGVAVWIRPVGGWLNSPGCKKDHVDGVNFPMSDASTMQPLSAESQEDTGHGRHRGPVSVHDGETAPRGRHRKQAEDAEAAA